MDSVEVTKLLTSFSPRIRRSIRKSLQRPKQLPESDAFGEALIDYHQNGELGAEFSLHREDGYKDQMDAAPYFNEFDNWESLTQEAIQEVKGSEVLDIGCGAGRHSLWLKKNGFDVVAVDRSPSAIEVTKERGIDECLVMDMRDLELSENSFDSVLVIGNMIGAGDSIEDVKSTFEVLDSITSPNARIIADSQNPLEVKESPHDKYYSENRISGYHASITTFNVIYGDNKGPAVSLVLLSPDDIRRVTEDTPWELKKVITQEERGWYSLNEGWYYMMLEKEQ